MKSPVIFVCAFIATFVKFSEAHNYQQLITNIYDKYRSTDIIIVGESDSLSFREKIQWHRAARIFSDHSMPTSIITFQQFEETEAVHKGRTGGSMIVIIIDTIHKWYTFEFIIRNVRINYGVWLITFIADAGVDVCTFCRDLNIHLTNQRLDTQVLISCCDTSAVEAWLDSEAHRISRYTLEGRGLRIVAGQTALSFRKRHGKFDGFGGEVFTELSRIMNFTVSNMIWEPITGNYNDDKISNSTPGAIAKVHRHEVDMSGTLFTINAIKLNKTIVFTAPLTTGSYQLHFKTHEITQVIWSSHFRPFTVDVWLVIIGLMLITPILLIVIKYKRRLRFLPLLYKEYSNIWGMYCGQSIPEFPKEVCSRIICVSVSLPALVLYGAYSAFITSKLATPALSKFSSMEEFVRDGTYKLIVLDDASHDELYKFVDKGLMEKMISMLVPMDLRPESAASAFERICNERAAFYAPDVVKKMIKHLPCSITSIDTGGTFNAAFVMPSGSKFIELINYHIGQLRLNGVLQRLEKKYFSVSPQVTVKHLTAVDLPRIITPLVVLTIGFSLASIIFIIEYCWMMIKS